MERKESYTRKSHSIIHVAVWLLIAFQVFFSLRLIDRPGVYYDEALHAPSALQLIYNDMVDAPRTLVGLDLPLPHLDFLPVMVLPYLGALKSYILALSFLVLGNTVLALRLPGILMAALSTALLFQVAKRVWGDIVAFLACALLATDATWIFFNRVDWGPVAFAALGRVLTLVFLLRWHLARKRWDLLLAGLVMGLGLWDKANFMWFVIALLAWAGVYYVRHRDQAPKWREGILVTGGFFLGSAPFWFYNLFQKGRTLTMLLGQGGISEVEMGSIQNRITIAYSRFQTLLRILDGRGFDLLIFSRQIPSFLGRPGGIASVFFLVSLLVLVVMAAWPGQSKARRYKLIFLPFLIAVIGIQMCVTPLIVSGHHLISLYPFPHLAIALASVELVTCWPPKARKVASTLVTIAMLIVLAWNGIVLIRYQALLTQLGGCGYFSSAISSLSYTLETEYRGRSVHLLHWGLRNQLNMLSRGQILLDEPFWSHAKLPLSAEFKELVTDPNSVFVLYVYAANAERSAPNAQEAFRVAIDQEGMQIVKEREFYDYMGEPIYTIVELAPSAYP